MRRNQAQQILHEWDRQGRYVYIKRDLGKLFGERSDTLNSTLRRLLKAGILVRAAHNVYVYAYTAHAGAATLDLIARALRRGELVYESLESALSAYGIISQIPVDRRTYMTTGRTGEYRTPYGVAEFTHTKEPSARILPELTEVPGRGVPVASPGLALRNIKSTKRNLDIIDMEAMDGQRQ